MNSDWNIYKGDEPFYQFVRYHTGKSEIRLVKPGDPYTPAGYSMCSGGRPATEAELREKNNIQPECCECGEMYDCHFDEALNRKLIDNKTCFHCDFWRQKLGRKNALRIGGVHYMGRAGEKGDGMGGRTFRIRMLDGSAEFETSNLWCQGDIPPHFRERLPDNAEFVRIPAPIGHGQGYLG